jgi:hypothetical protein
VAADVSEVVLVPMAVKLQLRATRLPGKLYAPT